MKIQALILGAAVAAFASASFAAEPLLSPRAAGNQIKAVPATDASAITIEYADAAPAVLSPRAQATQLKTVKGAAAEVNPAVVCRETMSGTPKIVTECSSHANMPGCMPVAAVK